MTYDPQYGVFAVDEKGPLWKGFFDALNNAKLQAQNLADLERCEYFVFDVSSSTEVFRAFPAPVGKLVG